MAFHCVLCGGSAALESRDRRLLRARDLLSYSFLSPAVSQRYTLPELGFTTNPYLFAAIGASLALQIGVMVFPACSMCSMPSISRCRNGPWFSCCRWLPVTVVEIA